MKSLEDFLGKRDNGYSSRGKIIALTDGIVIGDAAYNPDEPSDTSLYRNKEDFSGYCFALEVGDKAMWDEPVNDEMPAEKLVFSVMALFKTEQAMKIFEEKKYDRQKFSVKCHEVSVGNSHRLYFGDTGKRGDDPEGTMPLLSPQNGIDTGTSNYVGTVLEFRRAKTQSFVGLIFVLNIPAQQISKEELYMEMGFNFSIDVDLDKSAAPLLPRKMGLE